MHPLSIIDLPMANRYDITMSNPEFADGKMKHVLFYHRQIIKIKRDNSSDLPLANLLFNGCVLDITIK